ncbi:hypothetical protein [Thalassiella azotivora]
MSSPETSRPAGGPLTARHKATFVVVMLVVLAAVLVGGLLLREHGPGNMGNGFLQGAAVGLVGAAVAAWRVGRGSASSFERAWTQTGDERDDALLTRALAVVGLLSLPLTAAATVAVGVGADAVVVLGGLVTAFAVVLAASFGVLSRRG